MTTRDATRRTLISAGLGASVLPRGDYPFQGAIAPTAEGGPGPGRILVWVDERQWWALISAAKALGSEPD